MSTDDNDNGIKPDDDSNTKGTDPCLRCGAPVEINGEMLCKKCEKEVH
jgi:hypothetical protein